MEHSQWTINPLVAIFKDGNGNITSVSANAVQIEARRWSFDNQKPYVTDFEKKCSELEIPPEQVSKALDALKLSHG